MLYLKNLSSQELFSGVLPWDFKPASPIPDEVRKNKKARDQWINLPTTVHHVYTPFEGVNSNIRISKLRTDGGGNPPHSAKYFAADYDSAQPEETVLRLANELPYPPNWIEKTLSGNWRYVWILEEALIFPSYNFAKHFLQIFPEVAFDISRGMVGFDKPAWEAPERCYTNSGDWRKVHDAPLPKDLTNGWLVKASEKFKFTTSDFGPAVPIEEVRPELEKKYPKFAEWPGEFVVGSQGPSFWLDESLSPKSAVVRETGIQTFSAHAPKAFYSWADLVGIAFVKKYEAESTARAVENIFHDGRAYWRKLPNDYWKAFEKADISMHLKVSRGVTPKPDKSGVSPVESALEHIQNMQHIEGAAPFLFRPAGLINRGGLRYLNTSNVKVLTPAEGVAVWGPDGQFPWLSQLTFIIPDAYARSIWLAWLAWAYKHAYKMEPTSGQVLFLCGPAGTGKTLLNRGVMAGLFGGLFAEAGAFLTQTDGFNSELFNVPWWCQDDGSIHSGYTSKVRFTEMIKRVAANSAFRCNEKFKKAVTNEWLGRLVITCNADEESIRQIPETNLSNADKLILIRTSEKAPHVYPSRAEVDRILARELPWFARWLLDWKIPAELMGESRFGVKHYADPTLVETSRHSSPNAGFSEILEDWRRQYFTMREPKADFWEGTAYQLQKEILLDPTATHAMRDFTVDSIGRHLVVMKNKGERLEVSSNGENRVWKLFRPHTTKSK